MQSPPETKELQGPKQRQAHIDDDVEESRVAVEGIGEIHEI
jgi:hypothetical protein